MVLTYKQSAMAAIQNEAKIFHMTSYGLLSHFEALGPIIRQIKGLFSIITPRCLEASVNGQRMRMRYKGLCKNITMHAHMKGVL